MITPHPNETLYGQIKLTVTMSDGSTEEVAVLQLPISSYPALTEALDDEVRAAEIYAGKERGWGARLSPGDHERIITEGERINSDFFGRWLQRRLARQEKVFPGIADQIRRAALPSPTTLPSSASTPA